jgi:hypothetical protein
MAGKTIIIKKALTYEGPIRVAVTEMFHPDHP